MSAVMPSLDFDADGRAGRIVRRVSMLGRRVASLSEGLSGWPAPRFMTIAAVMLGATGLYGMVIGGHTTTVVDSLAQPMGFALDTINVSGNRETTEIDVLQILWGTGSQSLVSLDPDAARQALEAMPWIEAAAVKKVYPDRVDITLTERQPFALWQRDRDLFIVDREGREIVPYAGSRFASLPLVVGRGAEKTAAELLDTLDALPGLKARTKAFIRVGDRRWDLRLDNGITIRLPEKDPVEAAAEVMRMDREEGLLERDILSVDMRVEDQMIIKLTPDAVVRRNARLKERDKLIKQRQKENKV
ncbi:cell division protein FtsQ/DivIB [Consotaella salsifontis]|uniref:Cell division protein FtsQ n=1 Tax=Consotaella salsifontis TaxID=1365950 RepID=A0A1T4M9F6_9HYPH|nr:cell division protein FtsQ/DivIB [Consotaella salsifontis]SJZ63639.1 cell division protein FtsQ [Consotaella salsifontis]